jgi:hypothetical protein
MRAKKRNFLIFDVRIAHFILYVKQSEFDKRMIENEKEKMCACV